MKKIIITIILLALMVYGYKFLASIKPKSTARAMEGTPQVQATRTVIAPTNTEVPTATTGWQATADADHATANSAQATANGWSRLAIDATMQSVAMTHEMDGLTVTASWSTVQAVETVIPITQTHASNQMTAAVAQQTAYALSAYMTITAPTQIVALARAQTTAKYSGALMAAQMFVMICAGLGFLAVGYFVAQLIFTEMKKIPAPVVYPRPPENRTVEEPFKKYTPIAVQSNNRTEVDYYSVPCSPEALTELADGIVNQHFTLGINFWEENGKFFKNRDNVIIPVREFFHLNHMAQRNRNGELAFVDRGIELLTGWLDNQTLPPPYSFAPGIMAHVPETAHNYENHTGNHAEGEGL